MYTYTFKNTCTYQYQMFHHILLLRKYCTIQKFMMIQHETPSILQGLSVFLEFLSMHAVVTAGYEWWLRAVLQKAEFSLLVYSDPSTRRFTPSRCSMNIPNITEHLPPPTQEVRTKGEKMPGICQKATFFLRRKQ